MAGTKHLLSVRYEAWKESSKAMRSIKKSLKEQEVEAQETAQEIAAANKPVYHQWKNAEGKTITAQFVKLSDDNVTLKMRSGKQVNYPMGKLNTASQDLAKSLVNQDKNQ